MNVSCTYLDVGESYQHHPLWRHYFPNTQALIFVVDTTDIERIPEATKELHKMLREEELRDAILLVFANKQDLPQAISASEVTERLGLQCLRTRRWQTQAVCAVKGQGLYEGLDWLSEQLTKS